MVKNVSIEDVVGITVLVLIASAMIGPMTVGVDTIVSNVSGVSEYLAKIIIPVLIVGILTSYIGE